MAPVKSISSIEKEIKALCLRLPFIHRWLRSYNRLPLNISYFHCRGFQENGGWGKYWKSPVCGGTSLRVQGQFGLCNNFQVTWGGKIKRTRGQKRPEPSKIFQTWQNSYTHELSSSGYLTQDQASQHFNMKLGGAQEPQPLAKRLLTVGGFLGRENQFSWRVWPR